MPFIDMLKGWFLSGILLVLAYLYYTIDEHIKASLFAGLSILFSAWLIFVILKQRHLR